MATGFSAIVLPDGEFWDFPAIPDDGDERRLPKRADYPGFTGAVAVNEQPKLIADLRLFGALGLRAGLVTGVTTVPVVTLRLR